MTTSKIDLTSPYTKKDKLKMIGSKVILLMFNKSMSTLKILQEILSFTTLKNIRFRIITIRYIPIDKIAIIMN